MAIAAESRLTAGKIDQTAVSDIAEQTVQVEQAEQAIADQVAERVETELSANKVLAYDPADIAAIGNQNESGHTICCPSYACAYADAVLDGTVNDHSYYTCSCCSWQDWGGGNSSYRCVGSDEEVLREAYDQISSGKPVVTHVSWEYGEHWIALIGYRNVEDPDHLTLDNFIALNPSDGAQIVASNGYALYGDGCQHVSER
ncbi:MAG: C39 family peptidase [Eggerthellaceae bacterium]|nr:C39 family peptidase [Eggerthellaceae bacterium]